MDVVRVMAAYLPVVRVGTAQSREAQSASLDCAVHVCTYMRVYTAQSRGALSLDCAVHTRTTGKYAAITPTLSMSTDTIEPLL